MRTSIKRLRRSAGAALAGACLAVAAGANPIDDVPAPSSAPGAPAPQAGGSGPQRPSSAPASSGSPQPRSAPVPANASGAARAPKLGDAPPAEVPPESPVPASSRAQSAPATRPVGPALANCSAMIARGDQTRAILDCLIQKHGKDRGGNPVRAAMSERFIQFLVHPHPGGVSYLAPSASGDSAKIQRIKSAAKKYYQTASRSQAVDVYVVMGWPAQMPNWAAESPYLKKIWKTPHVHMKRALEDGLKAKWRNKVGASAGVDGDVKSFFQAAYAQAKQILDKSKAPDIKKPELAVGTPVEAGDGAQKFQEWAQKFKNATNWAMDAEARYFSGGKLAWFFAPESDKTVYDKKGNVTKGGSRALYIRKGVDADGKPGYWLTDVTGYFGKSREPLAAPRYPAVERFIPEGDLGKPFYVADWQYKMTVDGDKITIQRAVKDGSAPGAESFTGSAAALGGLWKNYVTNRGGRGCKGDNFHVVLQSDGTVLGVRMGKEGSTLAVDYISVDLNHRDAQGRVAVRGGDPKDPWYVQCRNGFCDFIPGVIPKEVAYVPGKTGSDAGGSSGPQGGGGPEGSNPERNKEKGEGAPPPNDPSARPNTHPVAKGQGRYTDTTYGLDDVIANQLAADKNFNHYYPAMNPLPGSALYGKAAILVLSKQRALFVAPGIAKDKGGDPIVFSVKPGFGLRVVGDYVLAEIYKSRTYLYYSFQTETDQKLANIFDVLKGQGDAWGGLLEDGSYSITARDDLKGVRDGLMVVKDILIRLPKDPKLVAKNIGLAHKVADGHVYKVSGPPSDLQMLVKISGTVEKSFRIYPVFGPGTDSLPGPGGGGGQGNGSPGRNEAAVTDNPQTSGQSRHELAEKTHLIGDQTYVLNKTNANHTASLYHPKGDLQHWYLSFEFNQAGAQQTLWMKLLPDAAGLPAAAKKGSAKPYDVHTAQFASDSDILVKRVGDPQKGAYCLCHKAAKLKTSDIEGPVLSWGPWRPDDLNAACNALAR